MVYEAQTTATCFGAKASCAKSYKYKRYKHLHINLCYNVEYKILKIIKFKTVNLKICNIVDPELV
jgi:hypothetical protein